MQFIIPQTIDLRRENTLLHYEQQLAHGDDGAHKWCVTVLDGGKEADLTGAKATCYFTRAANAAERAAQGVSVVSVIMENKDAGNPVEIEFEKACYAGVGRCVAEMRLTKDGRTVTLARMAAELARVASDAISDPGNLLPSIEELLAQQEAMIAATEAGKAATADANAAAARANAAADNVDALITEAEEATERATQAVESLESHIAAADEAAAAANSAAQSVEEQRAAAEQAAAAANAAAGNAQAVIDDCTEAAQNANTAAENANNAAARVDAQVLAAQSAAQNAEADAAAALLELESLKNEIEALKAADLTKVDDGEVVDGSFYMLANGERVAGPFTGFGGGNGSGGGSGGNNAELTVKNTTGWLSKTVTTGASCPIQLTWSSLEDGLETGAGVLTIRVGGVIVSTRNINQGDVSVDVGKYLAAGSNSVRVSVADAYGNSRTINFTITAIALTLSSSFDATVPYSGAINYTYTPTGAVSKELHFELDGDEIGTATTAVSGRQQSFIIPAQEHGAHLFRVWFTAKVDGEDVESNILVYDLICIEAGNETPIISCAYTGGSVKQLESIAIDYQVYDPTQLEAPVKLYAGTELVGDLAAVDRTVQTWTFRAEDVGSIILYIECGETTKSIYMTVTANDIDVSAETEALALYLGSYGRSNSEADPAVWTYGDIEASFTGFNWVSDGWQKDSAKNTVLRVSGDARVEIPYQVFASDFRTTGKTIEVEFASSDVLDYDAMILSSVSGGRGIEITAQRADLTSEQSTIGTQYKEDEHVRLSFVVEKRSGNRLILIYLNGIISGVMQYPDDDDFSQATPVGISIGSNDCTIDIYNIRVYNMDLTRYQILDNWIADTQDAGELYARYTRNNVYDDYGAVVKENLPKTLPYMILEGPQLPTVKGTKVNVSGSYVDPIHPEKSFTFTNASADVQGTSSKDYYVKNFKIKFSNGFDMNGVNVEDYAMRDDSIPVNTFTFKADVASSEGANNVELVRLYNDISPHKTPPQIANPKVRQGIDGLPIVMFWYDGSETRFIGKYNFNNDKATEDVFGFASGDESWEIRNNVSDRVMFKKTAFDDTSKETGWQNDFEARYPEDNTDTTNLEAFITWVMTTDRDTATGATLDPAVTYDGVTYTTDSAEYRLAKFRAELADHADVTSAQFYWLFTEFFLMVDSRAKNAFPTRYAADGKWCWLPYDMDTAIGINNEGALVFDYGLEDTDLTESGALVFNGQNSVFWKNVRDAYPDEIKAMYVELRTSGKLTYADVMKRFDDHQDIWPEAIMNEDAYRKYIEPYDVEGATMYFPMCQGKKELQRTWWLYNRFRYMDAKYDTGDVASDSILIRIYGDADIDLIPYADTYLRAKFGSYQDEIRAKRGNEYTLHCFVDTANDLETTIFPASLIAEIADLSGYKIGLANFAKAVKLQVLKIGDGAEGYSNGNLTELSMGNNKLLRQLDVRNCPNLAHAVDLSGCTNIEEVYFDGTSITGLSLPNGGMLKKLHLPGTVTNLTLLNQSKITEFVLPSYSQITTLRIENASSAVPVDDILMAIPANSRVRIIGFDWTMDTADEILTMYDYLDTMRGLDENGNNVDTAQMSGTIHIGSLTGAQLSEMKSRYPYIQIDYEHIESYCYFYNGDTLLYTATCYDGADAVYSGSTPTKTSTAQYSYTFSGWSKVSGGSADSNALKAVTDDRNVYAAFTSTVRTYTVRWYNGSTLLETDTGVAYGTVPTYNGGEFAYTGDGDSSDYEFNGWSPAIEPITENVSYYAIFKYTAYISIPLVERELAGVYINDRIEELRESAFQGCKSLTKIDLPSVKSFGDQAFINATKLDTLILRTPNEVCVFGGYSALTGSAINNGNGYIYVPASLVDSYKVANHWSRFAEQIRAIEDYPEITGGAV